MVAAPLTAASPAPLRSGRSSGNFSSALRLFPRRTVLPAGSPDLPPFALGRASFHCPAGGGEWLARHRIPLPAQDQFGSVVQMNEKKSSTVRRRVCRVAASMSIAGEQDTSCLLYTSDAADE